MWKPERRAAADRRGLRYESDLTDAEWTLVAPLIRPAKRGDRHRFVVLPKRWIVERTLAWISRCRRLARDYERHARKAAAFVRLAMIRLMLRRLSSNL